MYDGKDTLNEATPRLDSSTGGLSYSIATVFYIVMSLAAGWIIGAAGFEEGSDGYVYISYIAPPIALVAAVAVTLKTRKVPLKQVAPVKCKPKYYLIGLLLIFGLLFSLDWVNTEVVKFFGLFGYKERPSESYFPDLSGGLIVPALIVIALLPALFEELLFRGVILNSCERDMGGVRAIFTVGFCFSLFHCSPEQTVYQFIAGCIFAFIAVRSRSIMPSVMMHFINNALIVILQACGALDGGGNLVVSSGGNIALTVVSACCLAGGLALLIFDKTPLTKVRSGGVKSFFIYGAVGIIILAVMWICSLLGVS